MLDLIPLLGLTFLRDTRKSDVQTRLFEPDFLKIRCPRCHWRPQKDDRWLCSPGCLHSWNTFDTAGVCPGCAKHWHETACLHCDQWSPHADWYEHSSDVQ
jgi:predicted amidophosphoribosyltransferase